jgi:hypothetical protein
MNPPLIRTIGHADDSEWLFRLPQQLLQAALLTESARPEFDSARVGLLEVLRQCNDARRKLARIVAEHSKQVPPLIAVDRIPQNELGQELPLRWRGILLDQPTP